MTKRFYTAHIAVKIVCFALILVTCFTALNRIFNISMTYEKTGVDPEAVLSSRVPEEAYFDRHMRHALYQAEQVMYFVSEAEIAAGRHLQWMPEDHGGYYIAEADIWVTNTVYVLYSVDAYGSVTYTYGAITGEEFTHEARAAMVERAISDQLFEFRNAIKILDDLNGLIYHLRFEPADGSGAFAYSNVWQYPGYDPEDIRNLPVYLCIDFNPETRDVFSDSSHPDISDFYNYGYFSRSMGQQYSTSDSIERIPVSDTEPEQGSIHISLGYDHSVVNEFADNYHYAREAYLSDITIIAVCLALFLASLAVLVIGAGRRFKNRNDDKVCFLPIDKVFLDISLILVISWTAIMVLCAYEIGEWYWRLNRNVLQWNPMLVNIFFAGVVIAIAPPVLLWLTSFAKRVKAGRFWQYTLIYFLPSRFWRFCKRSVKSLWAGAPLMLKVGAISAISFAMLLFTGIFSYSIDMAVGLLFALIFTAAVAFFLLRYAKRIHTLEKEAKAISEGSYETPTGAGVPINAGGGELGSIADSISNISAGINVAVEERMKSERLKTELITNVSHDIRTPLTSIITYTDLLKNEGLDCEKAPEYLDILISKSERLKTLTDDLFEAAKAATGNIETNITELDIVSLANQVLGELDSSVKASGLDIRVTIPGHLSVKADGRLMWRVMENLLTNALKYSLPGSRIYLDAAVEDRYARIDVKNISAAELGCDPSELTERFKRGDESRTDGGSGLGLSIVQSFIAAQGGRFAISIDGDLFKASVWLPVAGSPPNPSLLPHDTI